MTLTCNITVVKTAFKVPLTRRYRVVNTTIIAAVKVLVNDSVNPDVIVPLTCRYSTFNTAVKAAVKVLLTCRYSVVNSAINAAIIVSLTLPLTLPLKCR